MAQDINIRLENGVQELWIGDEPVEKFAIEREFPRGKNGRVFLAKNILLNRKEVIKVWTKVKVYDKRDKLQQGIAESQKLAAAAGNDSVTLYGLKVIGGLPVANMEFFDGQTLGEFMGGNPTKGERFSLACQYLQAIQNTSTRNSAHGDPHAGNVLVRVNNSDKYCPTLDMKLCDFGTSMFSGPDFSMERHWKIVLSTMVSICKGFRCSDTAEAFLKDHLINHGVRMGDTSGTLDDIDHMRCFLAPYSDFLDYHQAELRSGI